MSQVGTQVKKRKRMIENQQQKGLNESQMMSLRVGLRKSRQRHPHQSPGQTRRTIKQYSESIFMLEKMVKKLNVIDMQIEAQKAVRRITDHLEIVRQYPNVVRVTCFYQKLRLCSCGTKPQHSGNHQYHHENPNVIVTSS